jgi:hypothetical protein
MSAANGERGKFGVSIPATSTATSNAASYHRGWANSIKKDWNRHGGHCGITPAHRYNHGVASAA